MIRATISEVKDGMSAYLRRVKAGESVLVMERRTPIARIVPVGIDSQGGREGDRVDAEAKVGLHQPEAVERPAEPAAVGFPVPACRRPNSKGCPSACR